MRVRVVAEHYRVVRLAAACRWVAASDLRHAGVSDAVAEAMRLTLDRGGAHSVERVTEHEPCPDAMARAFGLAAEDGGGRTTQTITGRVHIPGPSSYRYEPRLSRYHPVNGWAVPESIDPDEDAAR